MKILRKNDDFRKMQDKSVHDILVIQNLINQGWSYCSRQTYKDFIRKEEKPRKEEKQNKEEKSKKVEK